ncbi:MAG: SCO2322 family protein [Nocardioidaceae bacterium]
MLRVPRLSAVVVAAVIAATSTSFTAASAALPASGVGVSGARSLALPTSAAGPHTLKASVGYTYWGFYSWDASSSSWSYMKVGANDPSTATSKDGSVFGFRWALVVKDSRLPRAPGTFSQLCGTTPKAAGKKRIGFVLDYGTPSDAPNGDSTPAPEGSCASVDESATVQQALLSVTDVRLGSSGLICGIHGYPSSGCGSTDKSATEPPPDKKVTLTLPASAPASGGSSSPGSSAGSGNDASPATDSNASDTSDSTPTVLIVVGVVVLVLLVGGALVVRRRSA